MRGVEAQVTMQPLVVQCFCLAHIFEGNTSLFGSCTLQGNTYVVRFDPCFIERPLSAIAIAFGSAQSDCFNDLFGKRVGPVDLSIYFRGWLLTPWGTS